MSRRINREFYFLCLAVCITNHSPSIQDSFHTTNGFDARLIGLELVTRIFFFTRVENCISSCCHWCRKQYLILSNFAMSYSILCNTLLAGTVSSYATPWFALWLCFPSLSVLLNSIPSQIITLQFQNLLFVHFNQRIFLVSWVPLLDFTVLTAIF